MFSSIIGLLYPYITSEPKGDPPDGAMVIRCVAVFVGIYQASTVSNYLYFTHYMFKHTSLTITLTHNLENLLFKLFRAVCYSNGISYWNVVAI